MSSKRSNLARNLGGKWKYDGIATWWCDDNIRHVSRCSAGVDEYDNEVGPVQYWLYDRRKSPERAERFLLDKRCFLSLIIV